MRFASSGFLLVLATAGPLWAAPVAPAGADPTGAAPPEGAIAFYGTAGIPVLGAGADTALGTAVLGLELSAVTPGAIRPEAHLRWPVAMGRWLVAPRLSVAWSGAAIDSSSGPTQSTLEAAGGLIAAYRLPSWGFFLDGGPLWLSNLELKEQMRLYFSLAGGARWQLEERLALAVHAGALFTRWQRRAPFVGLTASYILLPRSKAGD
jgi:hypothetical protein